MSKKKNKTYGSATEPLKALVPVGHDYRGKEKQIKKSDTTAPDGISGDWS